MPTRARDTRGFNFPHPKRSPDARNAKERKVINDTCIQTAVIAQNILFDARSPLFRTYSFVSTVVFLNPVPVLMNMNNT